ncbi:hypothetical protein [Pantoea ananatis]|uniref:hypothetical protein n=1 Tax=Pantoea ananas TaxID=553 RepID=UPI0003B1E92E|nr:hypothetical protein [Pantoea ananatis]AMB75982.1 hypothetical protein AW734_15040 [Pantoea ananatis]ERM12972.1 hypothetical protein L585_16295 [Pantoea ananatis BRT175]PQL03849.1 hypothetical protein CG434_06615 [Pantoea ananatis]CRH34006.1 Uncharacterized protein BN1183_AY_01540 [Pantoea ananatis]
MGTRLFELSEILPEFYLTQIKWGALNNLPHETVAVTAEAVSVLLKLFDGKSIVQKSLNTNLFYSHF